MSKEHNGAIAVIQTVGNIAPLIYHEKVDDIIAVTKQLWFRLGMSQELEDIVIERIKNG